MIQTHLYEVAAIAADVPAKQFVLAHHYSATYPAARFRFGLYGRGGRMQGVAVFSHPCNDAVLTRVFAAPPAACVELGRFVLLDEVPGNGESWFLGRCFELLKRECGILGVLSFSDPHPRTASDGRIVFPGHIGTIYQAHNAVYLGRGTARRVRLLPDGTVLSDRAVQKLRRRQKGWRYVAERLVAAGADPPPLSGHLWEWARHWLTQLTRPLRHAGNHRYAWALHRTVRATLPFGSSVSEVAEHE